jgi:hypothetical protein
MAGSVRTSRRYSGTDIVFVVFRHCGTKMREVLCHMIQMLQGGRE